MERVINKISYDIVNKVFSMKDEDFDDIVNEVSEQIMDGNKMKVIIEINSDIFPKKDYPNIPEELYGTWESDFYNYDELTSENDCENIYYRVMKKERIIKQVYYERI